MICFHIMLLFLLLLGYFSHLDSLLNRFSPPSFSSRLHLSPYDNKWSTDVNSKEISPDIGAPFFPKDIEELAKDASFSIQLALIGRMNRMRVDIKSKLLSKTKFIVLWLCHTAQLLINQEFQSIHVFIDKKYDIEKCNSVLNSLRNRTSAEGNPFARIRLSYICEEAMHSNSSLFIIFNPDNIFHSENPSTLEECQSLCFHASLRSIPVVMINPMLVSTSWSECGPQTPLLLGDFNQVYSICDDYMMLSREDHWFGIVQRITTGFELFFLQGMMHPPGAMQSAPVKYVRVKSWPQEVDMPDDIRSVAVGFMLQDPAFQAVLAKSFINDGPFRSESGVFKALHDMTSSFKRRQRSSSWRNIKPPPASLSWQTLLSRNHSQTLSTDIC